MLAGIARILKGIGYRKHLKGNTGAVFNMAIMG